MILICTYNIRDSWNHWHYGISARHFTMNSAAPSWFQDWCCAYPWPPGIFQTLQTLVMDERQEGSLRSMEDGDDFQGNFHKSQHSITFLRKGPEKFQVHSDPRTGAPSTRCVQYSRRSGASNVSASWLSAGRWPLGRWIHSKLSSDWFRQSTKPSW